MLGRERICICSLLSLLSALNALKPKDKCTTESLASGEQLVMAIDTHMRSLEAACRLFAHTSKSCVGRRMNTNRPYACPRSGRVDGVHLRQPRIPKGSSIQRAQVRFAIAKAAIAQSPALAP